MRLFFVLLTACSADPTIVTPLYLPQGITAAEARFATLIAVPQATLPSGLTGLDLCQRYIQRASFPDTFRLAPQIFDLAGINANETLSLDRVPGDTYVLQVEIAADNPISEPRSTLRGCTPDITVENGRTTTVPVCLCAIDDNDRITCCPE